MPGYVPSATAMRKRNHIWRRSEQAQDCGVRQCSADCYERQHMGVANNSPRSTINAFLAHIFQSVVQAVAALVTKLDQSFV
jgi:hypothetical protein